MQVSVSVPTGECRISLLPSLQEERPWSFVLHPEVYDAGCCKPGGVSPQTLGYALSSTAGWQFDYKHPVDLGVLLI